MVVHDKKQKEVIKMEQPKTIGTVAPVKPVGITAVKSVGRVKGKSCVPVNESKEAKFKRVCERRLKTVLHIIHVTGNCANKNTYAYSKEQSDKLIAALNKSVAGLQAKFESCIEETVVSL